ncbi:MAG: GNAT family N-acetyltransferase [Eubacteriales bacterium]
MEFSKIEDTVHLEYGIYQNGTLIGFINDCGVREDEIEIGYVIAPEYQGHGYATEAVRAMIHELRGMGFRKITAGYFEENAASRRVMEKAGMRPSGYVGREEYRGAVHTCIYCEICF